VSIPALRTDKEPKPIVPEILLRRQELKPRETVSPRFETDESREKRVFAQKQDAFASAETLGTVEICCDL